jgi:hypothetical protein
MNIKTIRDTLETADMEYRQKISDVATDVFYEHIKPYLDKKGYKFYTVNGGYWIVDEKGKRHHDIYVSDVLPEKLVSLLTIHVDGGDSFLGEWMPNPE